MQEKSLLDYVREQSNQPRPEGFVPISQRILDEMADAPDEVWRICRPTARKTTIIIFMVGPNAAKRAKNEVSSFRRHFLLGCAHR